jgi:hypothetical protein
VLGDFNDVKSSAAVHGGRAVIYDGPGVAAASDHRPVFVTLEFTKRPGGLRQD